VTDSLTLRAATLLAIAALFATANAILMMIFGCSNVEVQSSRCDSRVHWQPVLYRTGRIASGTRSIAKLDPDVQGLGASFEPANASVLKIRRDQAMLPRRSRSRCDTLCHVQTCQALCHNRRVA
jgi:hypothetical protein